MNHSLSQQTWQRPWGETIYTSWRDCVTCNIVTTCWASCSWAVEFYEGHDYVCVGLLGYCAMSCPLGGSKGARYVWPHYKL